MDPEVCELSGTEPVKEATVACQHGHLMSEGPHPEALPLTFVRVLMVPGEMAWVEDGTSKKPPHT